MKPKHILIGHLSALSFAFLFWWAFDLPWHFVAAVGYPATAAAAVAYVTWIVKHRRTIPSHCCQRCAYDMSGHEMLGPGDYPCPECGEPHHVNFHLHYHRRRAVAFTVIELLVVVGIIGLVVGITFPYLSSMVRSTSEQMAGNSVSNGVSAARAYSTRYKPFLNRDGKTGRTSEDTGDGYSGAVMIITPAREIRIAENDETAVAPTGYRLELPPSGDPIRNGYKPIERLDDMRVPGAVAVLGIVRYDEQTFWLLPPPFAISFNRRGQMVVRNQDISKVGVSSSRSDGRVYYDSDGDGVYEIDSTRDLFAGTYTKFFRDSAQKIENASSPMDARRELPWEVIEPVIGVVIFDPGNVPAQYAFDPNSHEKIVITHSASGAGDDNLLTWAGEAGNGVVMFFNRFTGADAAR